jgi:hypothetical protein
MIKIYTAKINFEKFCVEERKKKFFSIFGFFEIAENSHLFSASQMCGKNVNSNEARSARRVEKILIFFLVQKILKILVVELGKKKNV